MGENNPIKPENGSTNISHFESLEILRKASSDSLHNRQTYEWKMCITIWTPLVAFVGIALTYPHIWLSNEYLYTAFFFLAAIHILWQRNLVAANNKDATKILECEQKMRVSLGLPESEPPAGCLVFKGWAHYIYIIITFGLIVLAGYVNDSKRNQIVMLPNDLNEWLERSPEIESKKKDEYVAEILRKYKNLQDKEHQNVNPGSSSIKGEMLHNNIGEITNRTSK